MLHHLPDHRPRLHCQQGQSTRQGSRRDHADRAACTRQLPPSGQKWTPPHFSPKANATNHLAVLCAPIRLQTLCQNTAYFARDMDNSMLKAFNIIQRLHARARARVNLLPHTFLINVDDSTYHITWARLPQCFSLIGLVPVSNPVASHARALVGEQQIRV